MKRQGCSMSILSEIHENGKIYVYFVEEKTITS